MKLKKWISSFTIAGILLTFSGSVNAHVTVWPKEATAGGYEKYTVRVPVEKDINTIKVRVEFPSGVKVSTVMPVSGWMYKFEKDTEGRNKAIIWTATNGGIKPHEFMEFSFSGKNPDQIGKIAWKAYQTYADNTVVEWTGIESSNQPAAITTLKAGTNAENNEHEKSTEEVVETVPKEVLTTEANGISNNTLPLALSGIALLLSIISFFRKKSLNN